MTEAERREERSPDRLPALHKKIVFRDLFGGPVVRTLHFYCRGHGFDSCLGNYDPTCRVACLKR